MVNYAISWLHASFCLLACLIRAGDSVGVWMREGGQIGGVTLRCPSFEDVVRLTVAVYKALQCLSRDLRQ